MYLIDYMKKPFMEALKQDKFRSMPNSFLPPLRIPNPKRGMTQLYNCMYIIMCNFITEIL